MKKWLRRLRGALGMGMTWAVGWIPIGSVVGWLTGLLLGFSLPGIVLNYSILFGMLGLLGGMVFSTVVSIADGQRRFDELSLPRFAASGGFGGFLLGTSAVGIGLVGLDFSILGIGVVGVLALLGAASATATLAIARQAESADLLTESGDVPTMGLAREEASRLPGRHR